MVTHYKYNDLVTFQSISADSQDDWRHVRITLPAGGFRLRIIAHVNMSAELALDDISVRKCSQFSE